ncbi:hypothetical protein BOX15_Mlig014228g1 [Macrostomum lignano]|uniref:Mab-21-like HhH/H2TH-like domain-containing protein n=1 Tax=Macrostomum lignano TaxID=282301 RepID=A0A267F7K1_9PLAT|nr:hypothetical protein BOX15_Mlig014228g1 [Macrostomum lignano]
MSSEGSSGDNVDDSAYAAPPGTSSGMPIAAASTPDAEDPLKACRWALRHPKQEVAVLASLARADRGLRMRVCRGVFELCRRELGDRRALVEHCLLELADAEVDSGLSHGRPAWQLADSAECTGRLLARLRNRVTEGQLSHYFNVRVNLLAGLTRRERLAAAARLELFIRRPEALLRAATASATAESGSQIEDRTVDPCF